MDAKQQRLYEQRLYDINDTHLPFKHQISMEICIKVIKTPGISINSYYTYCLCLDTAANETGCERRFEGKKSDRGKRSESRSREVIAVP